MWDIKRQRPGQSCLSYKGLMTRQQHHNRCAAEGVPSMAYPVPGWNIHGVNINGWLMVNGG